MLKMTKAPWIRIAHICGLISVLLLGYPIQSAMAEEVELNAPGFALEVPDSWTANSSRTNLRLQKEDMALDGTIDADAPRMIVSTETRLDHAGALRRLLDIGGFRGATWEFVEIAGWPALQQKFVQLRPQPSRGEIEGSETVLVVQTVVAADNILVRMDTWLSPNASDIQVAEVENIGLSLVAPYRGNASEVARELEDLRNGRAPRSATPTPPPSVSAPVLKVSSFTQPSAAQVPIDSVEDFEAGFSVPVSTQGGRDSELEIAVSPDGRDIVIGSNLWWYYSDDAGQTWNLSQRGGMSFTGNDPSVAWGQSGGSQGTFYGANINTGANATSMITSTDGGAIWTTAPLVYVCGQNGDAACGSTFPDQEHIATDRLNLTAGGDQVYSAWRHLDGNWGLVCSQDSAATWSTMAFFAAGDLPKPAVGPDGFVYVIYLDMGNIMLDKFAPCEVQPDPMVSVGGTFPVVVKANANPVACPTPGLDRCNRRNTLSGITVAVDDTDSNHIYVTYAVNTNPGLAGPFFEGSPVCNDQNLCNENVIVQDSLDGGATWGGAGDPGDVCILGLCTVSGLTGCSSNTDCYDPDRIVTLNSGVTARRFMPWLCTIGGDAYVSWYDRRAAFPGGNTESNNSLTDFFAGSASIDAIGNLQSEGEFQVNDLDTEDAQCEAGFATGTTGSWPSATDRPRDSDDCSVQSQLGGSCMDGVCSMVTNQCTNGMGACTANSQCDTRCDYSDCGGQGMNNGSPQCACGPAFTCDQNRGSPKYGDYNGNACAAGRLYMTWASAEAPLAFPPATDIDSVFSSEVVCCVPQIQVPGNVDFGDVCGTDQQTETLNVCNTGVENLVISAINGEAGGQFAVTQPLAGWPVTISPDFCFPFEVTWNPDGTGSDSEILTVVNNDPVNPAFEVTAEGTVGTPDLNVAIADSGDFGSVCKGDFADLDLTLFNQGSCNLTISTIGIMDSDPVFNSFSRPTNTQFPLVLSPDAEFTLPVRYAPEECNDTPVTGTIVVSSDSPGEDEFPINISGVSPCPNLLIDPDEVTELYSFPATVVDSEGNLGCYSEATAVLRNNGACPLTISDIFATGSDYAVTAPTEFDIILPSGEETLEVTVRFTPEDDADPFVPNEVLGLLTIVSDDPDAAGTAELCGESASGSGIRLLVTDITSGDPVIVDPVESITVRSKGKNTPSPINLQYSDKAVEGPASVCGNDIFYHLNLENLPASASGGGNNKSQYQVNAKDGNLQDNVSFKLGQCELRDFQMQLLDTGGGGGSCPLLPKGASCEFDHECCSNKCKGPSGNKTCK